MLLFLGFSVGAAGSGKASKAIARHIPGNAANLEGMKERTGTVAGEVARTRMVSH